MFKKNGKAKYEIAAADETSLGNILVKLGFITQEDLAKAVGIQKSKTPFIGEILVDLKMIRVDQLEFALMQQKISRGKASRKEEIEFYDRHSRQVIIEFSQKVQKTSEATALLANKMHYRAKVMG